MLNVGLGPIGVLPSLQRARVGRALMHAVIAAADALDYPLVALLGHLDYYPQFGFVPASRLGASSTRPSTLAKSRRTRSYPDSMGRSRRLTS